MHTVRLKALAIFGDVLVSELVSSGVNGIKSFFVAPDGSKEGWDAAEIGDAKRNEFIKWLETGRYGSSDYAIYWAEVQYGKDLPTKLVRGSDEI